MTFWNDVRLAARLLLKDKGVTLPAIVALALGIGANTIVFTIVNAAFLRDLPFQDPDRVVVLGMRSATSGSPAYNLSLPEFEDLREASRTFDGLAAFAERQLDLADETAAAERTTGAYVSANAFELLGRRPVLGRGFRSDDDRPGAEPVVLLGHSLWQTRYQSASDVIGRSVRVNGVPTAVIGVMPEGFAFPDESQLWQPISQLPAGARTSRLPRTIAAFGRLAPGATIDGALADLTIVAQSIAVRNPETNANVFPLVRPFRDRNLTRQLRIVLSMLTGAVAFVLLIGCANVANLLMARAASREREVSLRMSMGASRAMIVRQLLVESLLLAIVAGLAGFGLSIFGVRAFALAVADFIPYWLHFAIDGRVFVFVAAICLGTSILFGLLPAVYTSRTSLVSVLNEAGRSSSGGIRGRRWTSALVTLQMAMTLTLLTGAGLMLRGVMVYFQTETGVDTANLVQLRLSLSGERYATRDQRLAFYRQLHTSLSNPPDLRSTFTSAGPRTGAAVVEMAVEGRANDTSAESRTVSSVLIAPGYFGALGLPIVRGREFTSTDGLPGGVVAIVNERFAAQQFPNEDPTGRRIRAVIRDSNAPAPEWATIVGVVRNVRQQPTGDGFDPVVYIPYARNPVPAATILVRSQRGVASAATQIRSQLRAIDPDLPLFDVMSVDDRLAMSVWERQVFGSMLGAFAVIALVLAAVGLYGVTTYSVSRRTREIGIRVALGAQARQVYWLVSRAASLQVVIGLAIGLLGGLGVATAVQNLQSEITLLDPVTFITSVLMLLFAAVVACLVPAHRATHVDPVAALRSE